MRHVDAEQGLMRLETTGTPRSAGATPIRREADECPKQKKRVPTTVCPLQRHRIHKLASGAMSASSSAAVAAVAALRGRSSWSVVDSTDDTPGAWRRSLGAATT